MRDLWQVASGRLKPPTVPTKPTSAKDGAEGSETRKAAEVKYEIAVKTYKEQLSDWNLKDARAREILTRSMDDRHHEMIRSCVTAMGMFNTLQQVYEQKSASTVFIATREFHELRWTGDTSAITFVSRLRSIASKLESLGEKISDAMLMSKIMNELPTT